MLCRTVLMFSCNWLITATLGPSSSSTLRVNTIASSGLTRSPSIKVTPGAAAPCTALACTTFESPCAPLDLSCACVVTPYKAARLKQNPQATLAIQSPPPGRRHERESGSGGVHRAPSVAQFPPAIPLGRGSLGKELVSINGAMTWGMES